MFCKLHTLYCVFCIMTALAQCCVYTQVKSVNHPATSLNITKLKKGVSYEFRVVAENVHGDSEPLVTDGPTTAENPFSKLCISFAVVFLVKTQFLVRLFLGTWGNLGDLIFCGCVRMNSIAC